MLRPDQTPLPILNNLHIAKPCPASWNKMRGTDQQRHCTHCNKTVYNLSAMDPAAITTLLEQHNHQLCARFYRRRDGTIMTYDCPHPTTPRRPWPRLAALAASLLAWFLLPSCTLGAVIVDPPATRPAAPDHTEITTPPPTTNLRSPTTDPMNN